MLFLCLRSSGWLIAQAILQCKARAHLPIILGEEPVLGKAEMVERTTIGCNSIVRMTEQKISDGAAGSWYQADLLGYRILPRLRRKLGVEVNASIGKRTG